MKLSVAMITYNHEKFIKQALQSVLAQEVDFEYEIVIGDDFSTDGTREVLSEYKSAYPHRIHLLFHESRLGPGGNLFQVLNSCSGEYIALLEGDDFWTSPRKLQIQADFLDKSLDCSSCFHTTSLYSESTRQIIGQHPGSNDVLLSRDEVGVNKFTLEDVLTDKVFPMTCSIVYRAGLYSIPEWFSSLVNADTPLLIFNAHYGLLGYINEILASYRIHNQGVWSGTDRLTKVTRQLYTFEILNRHYDYAYAHYFGMQNRYLSIAQLYQQHGNTIEAKRFFRKAFSVQPDSSLTIRKVARAFLAIYLPSLFRFYRSK